MKDNKSETILFIGRGFGYSGSEKSFRFATESIAPKFGKRCILCYHDDYAQNFAQNIGAELIFFEDFGLTVEASGFFAKSARMIKLYRCIKRVIQEKEPDACLAFSSFFMIPTSYACHKRQIILAGSERGTPQTKGKIFKLLLKSALKRYDILASQTEGVSNYLSSLAPYPSRKTVIIPNFCPDLPPVFTGKREKVICSAGRLCANKNFSLLIDAFSLIAEQYPEYKLEIYGDGSEMNVLRQKIELLGLNQRVFLMEFCENVPESIAKNSIFVLSSNEEGMPNVLMEAMAMGLACVTTDCISGGPRYLAAGERAEIVPCRDPKKLSEAIAKIINSPKLAEKLMNNAVGVREDFSRERISVLWENIF